MMQPEPELPPEPAQPGIQRRSSYTSTPLDWLKEIVQVILLVALLRVGMDTVMPRYIVDGASMEPNFSTSQRVIVDRVSMILFNGPGRGDVVVLDSPANKDDLLIKRVVGLPGETITIRQGRVYVDGVQLEESYIDEFCTSRACNGSWELGPGDYFVLGDNRSHSLDSHSFGPVAEASIIGIARLRYWPLDEIDILAPPEY